MNIKDKRNILNIARETKRPKIKCQFSTGDNRMLSLKSLETTHIYKIRSKKAIACRSHTKTYYEGIINNPMKA